MKSSIQRLASSVAFASFAALAMEASAAVTVLDFEVGSGTVFGNLESHGFRISPTCHIDIVDFSYMGSGSTGLAAGFDNAGCPPLNGAYLGPKSGGLYFDHSGQSFSLLSFSHAGEGGWLKSSKGGVFNWGWGYTSFTTEILNGPEWSNIEWIAFYGGGSGEPLYSIDNLTFQVPNPGTLALVSAAIPALFGIGRRRNAGG